MTDIEINDDEITEAEPEQLYPSRKVATMFHVTTETIRNWIKEGKIEGVKQGNRWYIRRSEMIRFANEEHGDPGL